MINLIEESKFWEYMAEMSAYIQHVPDATDETNRFAVFTDEATIKSLSGIGFPRLELHSEPLGNIAGNNAFQYDNLTRTLRVINKVEQNNYAQKLQVQQDCKNALIEMLRFIIESQQNGDSCQSKILQMFNVASANYQLIDNATADSTFAGCSLKIQLRAAISQAPLNYGPFIYP